MAWEAAWEEQEVAWEESAWEVVAWEEAAAWEEQEEKAWEEEAALTRRAGEPTLLRVSLLFRAAGIPSVEGTALLHMV